MAMDVLSWDNRSCNHKFGWNSYKSYLSAGPSEALEICKNQYYLYYSSFE